MVHDLAEFVNDDDASMAAEQFALCDGRLVISRLFDSPTVLSEPIDQVMQGKLPAGCHPSGKQGQRGASTNFCFNAQNNRQRIIADGRRWIVLNDRGHASIPACQKMRDDEIVALAATTPTA